MIVAAISWKLRQIAAEADFYRHLADLVGEAASRGAKLIVLPELIVLELLTFHPSLPPEAAPEWLAGFSENFEKRLIALADEYQATIVGGSHISEGLDGYYNVSAIASPNAPIRYQPKNILTTYEREVWNFRPHSGLNRMADPAVGVTVCYDSEFPESGRTLAESGVIYQCVPAFTESEHGFHRVRNSCLARAIENQVYIIHASLVGSLLREPVPDTFGSSAVLVPSVTPFPATGILDETPYHDEAIAIADCNPHTLMSAREQGDVRNWADRGSSDWRMG